MTLQYWFIFPIAVLFATIAMASGVGGATFFSPFFILARGSSPRSLVLPAASLPIPAGG